MPQRLCGEGQMDFLNVNKKIVCNFYTKYMHTCVSKCMSVGETVEKSMKNEQQGFGNIWKISLNNFSLFCKEK